MSGAYDPARWHDFATALAAVADVRAAVELLARLRDASSDRVSSFELIPRSAVELTTRHIAGVSDPLGRIYPWYVLCELGATRATDPLDAVMVLIACVAIASVSRLTSSSS